MDGMTMDFKIQTLLRQEDGWWVLQCLEYDIAAYGKRISDAIESFKNTFTGQVILDVKNGKEPLSGIGRAPEKYWDKFNSNANYYSGKYIAKESFQSTDVIAYGEDFSQVYILAESKGFKNPVVFYVPNKDMVHIY